MELGDGLRIMRIKSVLGIAGLIWPAARREAGRLAAAGVTSMAINILHLAAPAYALYVLTDLAGPDSRFALVGATLVVMVALSMQFVLVEARRRLLQALAERVELSLTEAGPEIPANSCRPIGGAAGSGRESGDLEAVIDVLGGRAGAVLCDLPWIVLFVGATFWLDPVVGLFVFFTTAAGCVALAVHVLRTLHSSRQTAMRAGGVDRAPAVQPRHVVGRSSGPVGLRVASAADLIVTLSGTGTFALALWLEAGEVTAAGAALAAALLASRATSILRSAAAVAPDILDAADAARRLAAALAAVTGPAWGFSLLPPRLSVRVDDLTAGQTGGDDATQLSMHLRLRAGDALAIVGPSGCGKTLLWQCLAGLAHPLRGRVLLDGVPLDRWGRNLSSHIGILPQDPELEPGTIAQNISRFAPGDTRDAVVAAAQAASVDRAIRDLPDGYATVIGEGGVVLSAGQRQRIALARALYGAPFLLLLDDPLSRLDPDGTAALDSAIRRVRARGGVVVSFHQHHPALPAIDRHAVVADERVRVVDAKAYRATQRSEGGMSQFVQSLVPETRPDVLPWGRAAGAPH
ncbi:MAG: ATP-binding cassette domain-containing protein [Burkholderiales bacterium]|nr:ATP-binding cassette domain-containing protein [Burkholderiales bacterium]